MFVRPAMSLEDLIGNESSITMERVYHYNVVYFTLNALVL